MSAARADADAARAGVTAEPPGVAGRRTAHRVLRRVHADGSWTAPAVDAELRHSQLDERDRGFAANLAMETLRWEGTLDWVLARSLTRALDQVEPALLDILRAGAWELLYGRAPDRAVVDTTVRVARLEVGDRATGFVNGVLRGVARQREGMAWPSPETDEGLALALGYPSWVAAQARARFGEEAPAVLEAGNVSPGLTLRVDGDRDAAIAGLRATGLDAEPGRWAPAAVRVPGARPDQLGLARDSFTVQDEASQLVTQALRNATGELSGQLVLDLCAGPGGKTTHLAALGAQVVAVDRHHHRALLAARLAHRLGLGAGVTVLTGDATGPLVAEDRADAVLVDAPCTGLGVVRRRPELRWRRSAAEVGDLAALQRRLLAQAVSAVRPGGTVLYSVCTWTPSETVEVVRAALADHDELRAEPVDLGGAGRRLDDDPGLQLTPDVDDADGMYVACLRRAG